MIALVTDKQTELDGLCRQYHVRTLELFGSATGDAFDPETSDLDFLVTFEELELLQYSRVYFGLLFALQKLFGRSVDLVMTTALSNPYFIAAINEQRTVVYDAAA